MAGAVVLSAVLPSHAYEALVGWQPTADTAGYKFSIGFNGKVYPPIDIGFVAPEPDGVCRVTVSGLPLGPTATFAVLSYDAAAAESPMSNSLSIRYRDAAEVLDSDGDGLKDAQEDRNLDQRVNAGETDPHDPDSDGDGWWDGIEISAGTDPSDATDPPTAPPAGCTDADCDDGNACTNDVCAGDECVHWPVDAACDDGNACNGTERCHAQSGCLAGTPLTCDNNVYCDGNETCDPVAGCVAGTPPACNDGISCTDDLCDPVADACTSIARSGRCDDGNVCTDDICSPASGCTTQPNISFCDDGVACTNDDICNNGICAGTPNCAPDEICALATGTCESAVADSDNDGLVNVGDPCPNDARNTCFGAPALDRSRGSIIRINSNRSDSPCAGYKRDCNGDIWVGDFGFTGSANDRDCNRRSGDWSCDISGVDELFACTSEQTLDLFRCASEDWGPAPESQYSFDVPPGSYLVNLYFANIRRGSAGDGSRVFDIVVEGETVYEAFDPVAASGGTETAVVRSAQVTVADDNGLQISLSVRFGKTTVGAIEVLAAPLN